MGPTLGFSQVMGSNRAKRGRCYEVSGSVLGCQGLVMQGSEFSTLVFGNSSVSLEGPRTLGFKVLGLEYLDTALWI